MSSLESGDFDPTQCLSDDEMSLARYVARVTSPFIDKGKLFIPPVQRTGNEWLAIPLDPDFDKLNRFMFTTKSVGGAATDVEINLVGRTTFITCSEPDDPQASFNDLMIDVEAQAVLGLNVPSGTDLDPLREYLEGFREEYRLMTQLSLDQ